MMCFHSMGGLGGFYTTTDGRRGSDMGDLTSDTQPTNCNLCAAPTGTVGRGKAIVFERGPAVDVYKERSMVIVSDGAYGVPGFEGDISNHLDVPAWYEPHVKAWAEAARPNTTLWFWNSEIGWAVAHPIFEKYGWRYVNCNRGLDHIAGDVNKDPPVLRRCASSLEPALADCR